MNAGFQYNEKEWMLADEYDLLIDDPTDYLLHVWLPRTVPGMARLREADRSHGHGGDRGLSGLPDALG